MLSIPSMETSSLVIMSSSSSSDDPSSDAPDLRLSVLLDLRATGAEERRRFAVGATPPHRAIPKASSSRFGKFKVNRSNRQGSMGG